MDGAVRLTFFLGIAFVGVVDSADSVESPRYRREGAFVGDDGGDIAGIACDLD